MLHFLFYLFHTDFSIRKIKIFHAHPEDNALIRTKIRPWNKLRGKKIINLTIGLWRKRDG